MKRVLFEAHGPLCTFPVGQCSGREGHWTHYAALKRAGIASIAVVPRLTVWQWDDEEDDTWRVSLDLDFDPAVWNTEELGLVYGDGSFQEAVQAWWTTLGFATHAHIPTYTEQGMQSDTSVSMETRDITASQWTDLFPSAHAAMVWGNGGPHGAWTVHTADVDA